MQPDPRVTATTTRRTIPSQAIPDEPTPAPRPPEPELGWVDVTLPSRGRFYGDKLPGGVIQVRPLMAAEMAMLATQGGSPIDKIEALLRACGRFGTLDLDDMLASDQLMAAFGLRAVTYGTEYQFDYYCERCQSKQRATVDIAKDCNERLPAEGQTEPMRLELPASKQTVLVRFLRSKDLKAVLQNAKQQARASAAAQRTKLASVEADSPSTYLYRLALTLVARLVDGAETPFKNILDKESFIRGLTARDALYIERSIAQAEPGVDTTVYLTCGACSAENETTIPFDAEFFRPTRV